MKNNGKIQGSSFWARPIIVQPDCVYVHRNIAPIEVEDGADLYEYEEIVYDLEEYIVMLQEQIISTQKALVQMYERSIL